jgi:DNA-directed RNA polymerase specialized sigma subunit
MQKTEQDYLTIQQYMDLAKKTIHHFCPAYKSLLSDDDAIDYIVIKIIEGDTRWSADRKCSRKTYRCSCAKWAIREYVKKVKPRKKFHLPFSESSYTTQAIAKWKRGIWCQDLSMDLANSTLLTDLEKSCIIKLYLENYKVDDIVTDLKKRKEYLKISRQSVYKACRRGIEKLKQNFGV